ncbi:MAG: GTP-binding protein [Desulfomonilaceae bacterium]|nr:GTP-binding protein [Desulfomonilaceae bacterium]
MIVNVVYGFLGAGKTTFIKYVMEYPPPDEKLVILVNEFGEIGIDGLILADQTGLIAEVVELPSGCICCTLAADFRRQFLELHERFHPDRIIIEPTGVAMISQIMQILEAEDLRSLYSESSLIHILDSSEFLDFVKRQRHFMENQLRRSRYVILNKIDRVKPHMVDLLVQSVKEINPDAEVYPTSFARVNPDSVNRFLRMTQEEPRPDPHRMEEYPEHEHEDGFAAQFRVFGEKYDEVFDPQRLKSFFEGLKNREYGDVVRAKGVFRTPKDWIKLELASGEVRMDPVHFAVQSAVSIVGSDMDAEAMESGLIGCQI